MKRPVLMLAVIILVCGAALSATMDGDQVGVIRLLSAITCDQTCLRGLNTPLVLVPGVPGKEINITWMSSIYTYGTSEWFAGNKEEYEYGTPMAGHHKVAGLFSGNTPIVATI